MPDDLSKLVKHIKQLERQIERMKSFDVQTDYLGWTLSAQDWTYSTSTEFLVVGEFTHIYVPGLKISWVQLGATKYAYVIDSSYAAGITTVTIQGGSTYTISNNPISSPKYSRYVTPTDFPHWIAYTATPTNFTIGNGTVTARFCMTSANVEMSLVVTCGTTSVMGTTPHFLLPVVSINAGVWTVQLKNPGVTNFIGSGNTSGTEFYPFKAFVSGSYIGYSGITVDTPFTWATGDQIAAHGIYGI